MPQGSSILNEPLIVQLAHKSNKLYTTYISTWGIKIATPGENVGCPFECETFWFRSNLCQWQIHSILLIHTPSYTHAHPLYVTLVDKHAHSLTLSLISPVSLQWAHCSATLLPPLCHIIEYRSLAFAAVCKRVCVWMGHPPRSSPWQPEHGVRSLCCHGAQVTGVTWKGGQEGVCESCRVWRRRERRGATGAGSVLFHRVFTPNQKNCTN